MYGPRMTPRAVSQLPVGVKMPASQTEPPGQISQILLFMIEAWMLRDSVCAMLMHLGHETVVDTRMQHQRPVITAI